MQTTLLGLAIAIILALVTALVAPLVVDWNHYRSTFEREASRLTGLNVRVNGTIDARILPTPLVKLHNIEVGEAGHEPLVRAGTIELEVGLGPLLRGEVRASEMHVIGPQISLGLDRSGAVNWPALRPSLRPEALSISRLNIEDGRVLLSNAASGSQVLLEKFGFDGDIRSFNGQFKGEGAFVAGDELYGYRISSSRPDETGGLKIRLGVDSSNHPLTTDIDGALSFDHGVPQLEGTFALARPVGATLSNGQRVMNDPWHASGKFSATPASASVRDIAIQYGPDERAVNFSGQADLTLGARPQFTGTISALQIDVDRAVADPDLTHRPPLLIAKSFVEKYAAPVKLPLPGDLHVGIDAMNVGGTTLQSLHGDIRFDDAGWSLNDLELRAPGVTEVNLSGRLKATPQGLAFTGPAALESADLDALLAWLKGRGDQPSAQTRTLSARGAVTIASDQIAVDQLAVTLDHQNVEGKLSYAWASDKSPANLDAEVRAAELDLDALSTFGKAALANDSFELPHRVVLALDVGKATFGGISGRAIKAQVKFDAGALQIDKFSVGELGGTALDISGRIDELSSQPRGRVTLNLDAHALAGLTDVVDKFAPRTADFMSRFADRLAPANVHGTLTFDRAVPKGSIAKLALDGRMGATHVSLTGDASGDPSHLDKAVVHVATELDANDSEALVTLLGLDSIVAAGQRAGRMTLSATGPLDGDLRIDGQLSAAGVDAAVQGAMRLSGDPAPRGTMQLLVSASDFRPLNHTMTGQSGTAVPVSGRAVLSVRGKALSFTNIAVAVGKTSVNGHVALNLASPIGIDGDIEANDVDAARVSAMLLGLPAKTDNAGGLWSSEPFGSGAFAAMNGAVTFKFDRAAFMPALVARGLKGVVRFRPAEITVGDIDGSLADGRVTGALAFRHDADGLTVHMSGELAGARAAALFPALSANAVEGPLTVKLQCDGTAQSPLGLVGFLHGSGAITLTDGYFAGFATSIFDAATRAADQSGTIEAANVAAAVNAAMANDGLAVPQGNAALTITAGRLSLGKVTLQGENGGALSLSGTLDLGSGALDARTSFSAPPTENALICLPPELSVTFKGPLAAPTRTLDVTALVGWLTLRAAELQTRRIELIEANRRPEALGPAIRPVSPSIRLVPPGTVVESEAPADVPAPGARGFDRLQPEPPAAPTTLPASPGVKTTNQNPVQPPPPPAVRSGFDFLFRPQN